MEDQTNDREKNTEKGTCDDQTIQSGLGQQICANLKAKDLYKMDEFYVLCFQIFFSDKVYIINKYKNLV